MPGVAEEESLEDQDKGELKYQESKTFHSEWFLCSAYDNPKTRRVTFEIYGLDTQDMFHLYYDYAQFDGLFRFNAELMNPNRKEGRFHWVIERLGLETVNKERKLKLMPEPTEEVPQLPVYETTRKIPTGRMDLKERQRLRESMDMLDIRRAENIQKKRMATRQRVLKHIMDMKEEDKRRKEEQNARIEEERKNRYKFKEEQERREREEEARLEHMRDLRRKAVEVKEERTEEQDEEEYRQLRARWRVRDAEKAKIIADQHAKAAKELAERQEAEEKHQEHLAEVQGRREAAWAARDERVRKKEAAKLKDVLEVKKERMRIAKLQQERNAEFLNLLHMERQPIFKEQLERTGERKFAREAEMEALRNYQEKRKLPARVNMKGDPQRARRDTSRPKMKAKSKAKADKEADAEGAGDASGKVDTERVLDAVEAKMRKEMEELRRREELQIKRDQKIAAVEAARKEKENKHNREVRESYRQNVTVKEQTAAERRLIMQQRNDEARAAEERKKAERARLDKVREANIRIKEKQRLQALCA